MGSWLALCISAKSLVGTAALFHDWGKASDFFQQKLRAFSQTKDPYRHEWISCQMLAAVAAISKDTEDDDAWMRLFLEDKLKEKSLQRILKERGNIVNQLPSMPPVMRLLAWLILSHHRLPGTKNDELWKPMQDILRHH